MESLLRPPASSVAGTGPRDLTRVELERYGLGIVVRHLRTVGVPKTEPLNRVYCLSCGIAIEHESRAQGWWLCRNECHIRGSH